MTLLAAYREARHDEEVARLRRVLALRAMAATGFNQRQIAAELGISQPAVSEYLGHADPGFNLRVYAHLMPTSDERARQAMDLALRPEPHDPRALLQS